MSYDWQRRKKMIIQVDLSEEFNSEFVWTKKEEIGKIERRESILFTQLIANMKVNQNFLQKLKEKNINVDLAKYQ